MTVDITKYTKTGFVDLMNSLSNDTRVQVAASSFNPVGLVGEMTLVEHGVSAALRAPGGSDSIMAFNIAVHPRADLTQEAYILLGYSGVSTGQVDWSAKVLHVEPGLDTTSAADHILLASETLVTPNAYVFTIFTVPAAGINTRTFKIGITRLGLTDANNGNVHIEGALVAFNTIGELA